MTGHDGEDAAGATLVEQLMRLIETDVPQQRRDMIGTFASLYLKRLPDSDIPDLTPNELFFEITDLLRFVSDRVPGEPAVRVVRPTYDANGYETPGSIVQVVSDDGPFLVDSVTNAVLNAGAGIVRHLHPVVGTERDEDGRLTGVSAARTAAMRESVQHFELDRVLSPERAEELETRIHEVLDDVAAAVRDFEPMRAAVSEMAAIAKGSVHHYDYEEIADAVAFLDWLLEDNFVFLGYREYDIVDEGSGKVVRALADSGLGILSGNGGRHSVARLADLPDYLQERYTGGSLMVITKTNRNSTVHRDARMDYVGLRRLDDEGRMIGELRLLGLFTSKAYMTPAAEIPVLHRKLQQVLTAQDVIEGSHDYKSLVQVFESFPKDDLFAMDVGPLSEMLGDIIETEESSAVRLFVRRDALNRYVSVLVTLPRDRFNADLRKQLQELFLTTFRGDAVDYRLALGESGDARIHFSVWTEHGPRLDVDITELEKTVVQIARNWDDRVVEDDRRFGRICVGCPPEVVSEVHAVCPFEVRRHPRPSWTAGSARLESARVLQRCGLRGLGPKREHHPAAARRGVARAPARSGHSM